MFLADECAGKRGSRTVGDDDVPGEALACEGIQRPADIEPSLGDQLGREGTKLGMHDICRGQICGHALVVLMVDPMRRARDGAQSDKRRDKRWVLGLRKGDIRVHQTVLLA